MSSLSKKKHFAPVRRSKSPIDEIPKVDKFRKSETDILKLPVHHESMRKEESVTKQYKDKFSETEKELQEKSAYVFENGNKKHPKEEVREKGFNCCGRTMKELLKESCRP